MRAAFNVVVIGIVAAAVCALAACNDERRYLGEGGVYQVALDEDTQAAFSDDEAALFIVETRIELPFREPSETTLMDLRQAGRNVDDLPFRRMPWIERGDAELEIDFTLINFEDREVQVAVIVNGFNEFHEYVPGVSVIDEEPVADFSQWERLYRLEPMERMHRTIREEELDEVAVDLATVVNGAPNSQEVVYFENKSADDERSRPFIPAVIPGLCGFRLGLRADQAARVLLEASVRVRDIEGKLADADQDMLVARPEQFAPVTPSDE
jgi:hypothetical protein